MGSWDVPHQVLNRKEKTGRKVPFLLDTHKLWYFQVTPFCTTSEIKTTLVLNHLILPL